MKKQFIAIIGLLLALSIAMTGCGGSPGSSESSSRIRKLRNSLPLLRSGRMKPMKIHKKFRFQCHDRVGSALWR